MDESIHFSSLYLFLLLLSCTFIKCHSTSLCPETGQQMIDTYKVFLESIKNTDRFYSSNQWEVKEQEHDRLLDACYTHLESTMTPEEEELFWSEVIQYYLFRHKGNVQIIFNTEIPKFNQLQTKVKQIWPDPNVAFEQIFKHATKQDFLDVLKTLRQQSVQDSIIQ